MGIPCLVLLLGLTAGGREQVLDDFQYSGQEAARQAWAATSGTPEVEVVKEDGRSVLQFTAPFQRDEKLPRTVLDRNVDFDLAIPGQFTLRLKADDPEAVGSVSLYFRSGNGWYAAGQGLLRKGWQTLVFSKAAFRTEGRPAGWNKIDGIRISVWRGQAKDSPVRLSRLAAEWNDVALIIPAAQAHENDPELGTALQSARRVSGILAELGLGTDAIEDAALARGALGDRRVAVLAYNPRLDDDAVAVLERFLQSGGKLLVCYTLPARLAKVIGVEPSKYVVQKQPGDFAEIRFDASDVPGLPKSVRQASWNLNTAEPAGPTTRVIGRWFDAQGNPTGLPAMLLSDNGAYLTHIVLGDDLAGKRQLLAAVLGHLYPPLWQRMAESAIESLNKVGQFNTVDDVANYVKSSQNAKAIEQLGAALAAKEAAERQAAAKAYPEAVAEARKARGLLAEAYLRAAPSPEHEARAVWNHSGTGAYPGDWDRTARELSAAGFNMIMPNMLWGGLTHYASDLLPRSKTFDQYGDQIAQCVEAAQRHGLEVHVWKVNFNLSTAPSAFVEQLRSQGRLQKNADGTSQDWLCPSHPENLKLEIETMLEVARKYDVDGLHFDYIRYPHEESCYCDGCRERFQADTGVKVAEWPQECYSGELKVQYRDWRCQQITRLVKAVNEKARKLKPQIKISAAVFGHYPDCRRSIGQDWLEWIKAGYLDFICPMDYTERDLEFTNLVSRQLKLVGGRFPVYPGIGAWQLPSPDRVVSQILIARELGAQGFTIFNLDEDAANEFVPSIGLGAGATKAVPPHEE